MASQDPVSAALSAGFAECAASRSEELFGDENEGCDQPQKAVTRPSRAKKTKVTTLASSAFANQAGSKLQEQYSKAQPWQMDKLLAKLTEQQLILSQRNETDRPGEDQNVFQRTLDPGSSSSSVPMTPATCDFPTTAPTTRPASASLEEPRPEKEELLRLKLQLAHAQSQISKLDQVLADSRNGKQESETASSRAFRPNTPLARDIRAWSVPDDNRSDSSDAFSVSGLNRPHGIWGPSGGTSAHLPTIAPEASSGTWLGSRAFRQGYSGSNGGIVERDNSNPDRQNSDSGRFDLTTESRRPDRFGSRFHPGPAASSSLGAHAVSGGQFEATADAASFAAAIGSSGLNAPIMSSLPPYQQQPIGTPLSPHASEFTSKFGWKSDAINNDGPTYLPPTEPLNYRRLLDRNVNCNWKYIVDKIVCSNDQQASIFLQQKLKVGTPEQKYEIVEAIVTQAYSLMVNRFGNFLVQRCFEHGTPEQVIKIAESIRGNTLNLSMDPFGCHVVQKAFDSVPEDYKAIMVHELLRRIPETVIHRYACHVWQKLFELRWTESPPQIMKYVNEALRGMWHEVALGETGSLVVQNIFENCLEEDKRPCIEEVLANIDIVAHGQFGNWCIQHICEHGSPLDRSRAIDHVIRYAAEYSTDQFASKVVEKCLKIGGADFLSRYLDRVCEGRCDRPRIPLIDIASDQYGNYLIQWILNSASSQHRDVVAAHIRKHMVSLRGSKFGSRVGMLCTNYAVTTRPGPGVGPGMNCNRMGPGPRYAAGPSSGTYR